MKKNIFILLSLLFSIRAYTQNVFPQKNTTEDKIYSLSKVWSEIKYNFVNIDKVDFDTDSLFYATIPKILNTQNDIEFYKELQRFMACFNDGHTQVIAESYYWDEYFDYVPVGVIALNNKLYLSAIRHNAGIDTTFLGAEIVEIEELPTIDYLKEKIYPYISASTDIFRLYEAGIKIQQGLKMTKLQGKAYKLNGDTCEFALIRNGETTRTKDDIYWGRQNTKRDRINLKWQDNIAVLTINAFYPEDLMINALDSVFDLIKKEETKGLIIDLRKNVGGVSEVAFHLQKLIAQNKTILTFGSQTRVNNGYKKSQGNYIEEYEDYFSEKAYELALPDTLTVDSSIKPLACPISILIGINSYSACEDFLVGIYETESRPIIIGEETGGSTGAPLIVNLPHEAAVRICTIRILYPHSLKPFVKQGIIPDIVVQPTIREYLEEKDVVLEKALYILNTKGGVLGMDR